MSIKPLFADPNLLNLECISSKPDLITIIGVPSVSRRI
jgi:hypothetical protein